MKIILTGSTGYIGREVLKQCLSHPSITSIVVLSRRDLNIVDPKLQVILNNDFTQYPSEILLKLAGAEACIYCLGTNVPVSPPELNRKINFEFAIGTAQTFAKALKAEYSTKPFKFVYLSGALPEKDPNKKLWFLAENRRMRGQLENALLQLSKDTVASGFEVFIARPGFVQAEGALFQNWIVGKLSNAIMVHHLAACMIKVALEGNSEVILENNVLNAIGKKAITS
ncbi:hypothetical protein V1525DRAFT_217724 [Lipomyces kononenkoae]|uniref:Uncharacterized protein n=1 Tax=Lipomyces kononenkoae TaxID=34357 RepID=A0ACC3SXR4_LIPKO